MTSRPARISTLPTITIALIVLGLFLRLWQFWANRSLWLDEAMVANNIVGRSFAGLLSPLDDGVVAPVGFLFVEKVAIALLGSTEYALRLYPLVAGLVASILMLKVASACVSRVATLLAVALFVFSERLIYFASEVKPYSSDVMWSLLLIFIGLKCLNVPRQHHQVVLGFGVVSAAAVWFSHPSVFIIAACFLMLLADALANRSTHSGRLHTLSFIIGSATLPAASVLIFVQRFVNHDSNVPSLQNGWRGAFMPLPPWKEPVWFGKAFYALLWNPMGLYFTEAAHSRANYVLAVFVAILFAVGVLSLLYKRWQVALMLTLPFLLTLSASALRRYPFADRLMMFSMPLCVLLLAEGIERTGQLLGRNWRSAVLCAAVFAGLYSRTISADWRNVFARPMYQHIRPAMAYLGARKVAADIVYLGYLPHASLAAVSYYAAMFHFDHAIYPSAQQRAAGLDVSLQTISNDSKASRVWIVFSSACDSCRPGQERIPLARIEQGGATRLDAFASRDASVYLYQLPN